MKPLVLVLFLKMVYNTLLVSQERYYTLISHNIKNYKLKCILVPSLQGTRTQLST